MSTVALSGSDVVNINGRILSDFADGDISAITFPNEIASVKTGKNGNSIYAYNATGQQCEFMLRMIRGSSDDKFLNGLLVTQNQQANFASTVLMIGEFVKVIGDGQGNTVSDTYVMSGGVFTKQVEGKSHSDGDTEQSVSIYHMKFTLAPRIIT